MERRSRLGRGNLIDAEAYVQSGCLSDDMMMMMMMNEVLNLCVIKARF